MKTFKQALKKGEDAFYERCKKRNNNNFYKCRKAVGRRLAKDSWMDFCVPRKPVYNYSNKCDVARAFFKRFSRSKDLNAFEFVALFSFFEHYFCLNGNSISAYYRTLSQISNYCNNKQYENGIKVDLSKHKIIWGNVNSDGYFSEAWGAVTTDIIKKELIKKYRANSINASIEVAKDNMKNYILHKKTWDKSWRKLFTEVRQCKKCGKFGSSKSIHDRVFYDGIEKSSPKSKLQKLKQFYGFCCVSCWNKYKPIEKMAELANELRLSTNRAMRLRKENIK